jgi:hypothetical protein
MGLFSRWFRGESRPRERPDDRECVLVHLAGTSLPDDVYRQCDVMTLSGQLKEALDRQGLGKYDGDQQGPTETTLFMHRSDAERLFRDIEAVLRAYPLCQNARVVISLGHREGPNVSCVPRV